ncbi:acyltransferase, partial [Flavobacterium sp.]|uniref:acyltransferase family protein n=1 Tax=Flavobacterium sp. TaxID=239 RepID=UPI0025C6C154
MKFIKLEFIRSAAAIYVLIVHYVLTYINVLPAYIVRFNLFGAEAVTAFFLLSGFVIYYSYIRKQEDFSIYFRKRFRRIYPLFIIAILITLICSYISNELFPLNIKEIIGNIFMLQNQEIFRGNIVFPVKGNPPFWSLANEWWYYMAFIPTLLIGKKYNLSPFYLSVSLSAVATIIYYMHPNFICLIAIYYAVWYAGAEMARVYMNDQNINFKNTRHILFSILLIAII